MKTLLMFLALTVALPAAPTNVTIRVHDMTVELKNGRTLVLQAQQESTDCEMNEDESFTCEDVTFSVSVKAPDTPDEKREKGESHI